MVLCVFSRISNQQPRKLPAFLRSFEISKRFHCSSLKSAFDVRSLGASFWYKETWSKDWCVEVQKWVQERIVRKKSIYIYIYIYTVPVPNAHITRIHLFGPFGQFQWLTMTLDATRGFSTLRWLLGCPFDGSSERSSMCLSQVYSEKKVWNPRRGWKGRWPLHKPAKINWSILRWHDWWRYPKW